MFANLRYFLGASTVPKLPFAKKYTHLVPNIGHSRFWKECTLRKILGTFPCQPLCSSKMSLHQLILSYVFIKFSTFSTRLQFNQTDFYSETPTQDFKKEDFVSKIMIMYIYSSAIKGGCNVVIVIVINIYNKL